MSPPSRRFGRGTPAFIAGLVVVVAFASVGFYALVRAGYWPVESSVRPALLEPSPSATTIGWIDEPVDDAIAGSKIRINGWALDTTGIKGVEARFDGKPIAARYGIPRADVARARPGFPDSASAGFEFTGDFSAEIAAAPPARHELAIVAIARGGSEKILGTKVLVPLADASPWRALYVARHMEGSSPFFVMPALSGVPLGGAAEIDTAYTPYLSPTLKVGIRVPILYVRTTRGAKDDWKFDPDWNIERMCGNKRIAEDSLSALLKFSIDHKVPVLITLNGGVWASASCNSPEWDVADHLRVDPMNCQWNEKNEVMPKDYLKNLAGSVDSPELARMLTFNVYAAQNRHYKKRNLQAAGRIVAAFARAHPDLFVGTTLDADTYVNPFFEEKQWYDYNPGTLKQFRQWLRGSGPYAGNGGPGVPDLRAYRRAKPLTLSEVNRLAGRSFKDWTAVDPPRTFPREGRPFWDDPWTHEWEVFRRHLVHLHYDDLSQWLAEVGGPQSGIFSGQGFMGPHLAAMPFAVRIDSPSKNYDTGGMSVEGALPKFGHLGAIVYGPGAANDIRMETQESLFATLHRMDPGWAVMEMNTADLRDPKTLPTYATAYRAFLEMFNYGARLVSPMAWNGSNGLFANDKGYISYTAWRNTPLEDAMRDFAVAHAYVPLGTRLWTFGTPRAVSNDGWGAETGSAVLAGNGYIDVRPTASTAKLLSPENLVVRSRETDLLVVGLESSEVLASLSVEARSR